MSSSLNRIKKSIMSAMQSANKQGTSAYDTTAVVRRIEGDIAWVHIAGGVDETPVKLTIAAKAGDSVQVRVGGGRAWITGNATAPPTDDQKANEANDKAVEADVKAGRALKDASDAMDEAKSAQDEANQLAINMANAVVRINADIENLQDQIDGNITTWFFDYDPTNANPPASEWISEGTESAHIGDLFYNNTSGYSWRWQVTNGVYSWQRVTDTDVAKALADAAKAQDTADSKRRVFYTQPIPPYDKGDLWVQGSGGDILRCAQDKVEGQVYVASDWVLASKYTDDSTLNNWLANTYAADKTSIQNQIDGKAETWYQSADPATNWTVAEKQAHTGDLWYRTSDGTTWYYTGSAWNQQQVPTSVFNAIDGKANIFIGNSTPQSPKEGDLWMQSANDDILTYVGNRWVKYNKYTDDTIANEAKTMAASTQQHFWTDSAGAHITEVSKEDFLDNPSGGNVLITSEEMQIRQALLALATFMKNGVKLSSEETEDLAHFYVQTEDGKDYSSLSLGAYSNPTILGYQDSNSNGELVMQARGQIIEEDPADSGVWFADIIEDESKILLRRTLSIGQSGHAYETSLSLWDGHIEYSSPEQREALLIGGDGGITSKGAIRGLSFRVSGHNSDIGTVVSDHVTTGLNAISVSGSTFEETGASFTLPAGSWQIAVSVRFPAKSGGIRKVSLRVNGTIYYASRSTCGANSATSIDVQSTVNYSSASSITIDVMGWQNSDTALTPSSVYWNCIRIA